VEGAGAGVGDGGMTEREMEDLIAAYPDDFFPNKGLCLKGRQQSFSGVGRFDLLFTDRFDTNVLMELKAVPARYEVATQLAKYRDELLVRGEKHILMWLVAPSISSSVREFLDRIGIEYTEIHETEFRIVQGRHGAAPHSESSPSHVGVTAEPAVAGAPQQKLSSAPPGRQRKATRKMTYESFKNLMESAVMPQHAANPGHFRLDGRSGGPNGAEAFRFRHNGKVWKIALDTWYSPLEHAYADVEKDRAMIPSSKCQPRLETEEAPERALSGGKDRKTCLST
jgi:endonuclease NucS-like protein